MLLAISMQVLVMAVIVFLLMTLILVGLLLFIKAKLTPSGKVNININGDNNIQVDMGGSLLGSLSENGIFLPSACGGKGSCGMCTLL